MDRSRCTRTISIVWLEALPEATRAGQALPAIGDLDMEELIGIRPATASGPD